MYKKRIPRRGFFGRPDMNRSFFLMICGKSCELFFFTSDKQEKNQENLKKLEKLVRNLGDVMKEIFEE